MFKITEFSKISQVSAKALRYYDQIGLLKPSYTDPDSESGRSFLGRAYFWDFSSTGVTNAPPYS